MKAGWLKKRITPTLSPELKKVFGWNVVLQIPILTCSAMLLDGGFVSQVCWFAAVVWWCGALIIAVRRPQSPTTIDMVFMHVGYVFLIPVCYFISPVWGWLSF
jgi:hypothetical protein